MRRMQNFKIDLSNGIWRKTFFLIIIIFSGILTNFGTGILAPYFLLPVYSGTLGTLMGTVFLGIPLGLFIGLASILLEGWLLSPIAAYYSATHVILGIFVGLMARKGVFQSILTTIIAGILLGVLSAIVNAPVSAKLSEGVYDTRIAVGCLFAESHSPVIGAILANLATEPLEKMVQCLVIFWMTQCLPHSLKPLLYVSKSHCLD